jgi:stress-induced morphogen
MIDIAYMVKDAIEKALSGAEVIIRDFSASDHLEANIIWAGFKGLSKLEQHQKVYEALGDLMKGQVHALTMKTWVDKPLTLANPSNGYFGKTK